MRPVHAADLPFWALAHGLSQGSGLLFRCCAGDAHTQGAPWRSALAATTTPFVCNTLQSFPGRQICLKGRSTWFLFDTLDWIGKLPEMSRVNRVDSVVRWSLPLWCERAIGNGKMGKLGHVPLTLCVEKQVWRLTSSVAVCQLFDRTFGLPYFYHWPMHIWFLGSSPTCVCEKPSECWS